MNEDYIKGVLRTEADYSVIKNEITVEELRVLHGILGLASDLQEFIQAKDAVNFCEEAGDLYWYLAILTDECTRQGVTVPAEMHDPNPSVESLVETCNLLHDFIKRVIFYRKALEYQVLGNLITIIVQCLDKVVSTEGYDPESIQIANIAKLKGRYPEKFSNASALNRDTNKEREILEKEICE